MFGLSVIMHYLIMRSKNYELSIMNYAL